MVPALCKLRKGRGTRCFVCASEVKSLGPFNSYCHTTYY